ncbi:hypothetical protein [Fictibacillus sp. S7]|uniref:hypothetical protein n=1 Tax=Fictibacillus sp. S7 TaxID=2212476 RepID=UPI0010117786|nr:hypothetical protein [Fictibacillus sp. S7]RXZ00344.1 hypothetical protein DMO16_12000 [Fictibacillus sp. S7]
MNFSINKKRISFSVLTVLIILCNFSVYRVNAFGPLPQYMGWATLFDFLIVIPLLAYLFIFRRQSALKYLPLVILAGYWLAEIIVPARNSPDAQWLTSLILGMEGIWIAAELFFLVPKLVKTTIAFRKDSGRTCHFQHDFREALSRQFKLTRKMECLLTECALFRYAFFSWTKRVRRSSAHHFSYHKKTSAVAFRLMLIHALLIESVGFHYLLMHWSHTAAILLLALNLYTLLYLVADIQVIRTCPILLDDYELILQSGLAQGLRVQFSNIQSIEHFRGPEHLSKEEQRRTFDALPQEFSKEKPAFEMKLKTPETARLLYGFTKRVDTLHVSVDENNLFFERVKEKLEMLT